MRGSWWHCACGSLPDLFFSSHASSSCLSSNPLPANPFHQSIQPACLGGCCSLAIDALIAVGHIEKIVLLVVILPGDKGTKWGAKAGNSLHVRKPNPEIIVTWADNFPFTVPLHLHWRLHFQRPERTLATVLLLHTGRTHFCTQGIYLKSHSQAVLQAWNRNSPDCSPVSQQWYGLKIETWTDLTGLKSPLDGIFNFSECFDKWLYF